MNSPKLKEVNRNLFGRQLACFYRTPNAVQYMIAVGFQNNLNTCLGDLCQKLSHPRLSCRVEVDLWVFDQQNILAACSECRNHDG